jgi:mRNA-degrading endonuclease HigB of HigAB toxin-antitoxin module
MVFFNSNNIFLKKIINNNEYNNIKHV